MAKYIGSASLIEHGAVDISAQMLTYELKPTQGEAGREDVSDKSSTTDAEYITTLRGDKKTSWSVKANDVAGGTSTIWDVAMGTSASLIIYPEGKTHGKPKITLTNAVVNEGPSITGGYKTKVEVSIGGYSFDTPTTGTHSST